MEFELIIVNPQVETHIALVQLNRPKELNALNNQLMNELKEALLQLDKDDAVKVIVLTGNDKAFAAGADIKQMASATPFEMMKADLFSNWEQIKRIKKPMIAAVSGFALGGGCELMMHCDIIVASETARIGQPEIKIGVMPGAGGTQRLTRSVGKALAMEMILTGRSLTAEEALRTGLINKVVPIELYLREAIRMAQQVAEHSPVSLKLAKEAVINAFNSTLDEGLQFERRNFYLCFASQDQKEGMNAFIEKRSPQFEGK
ncbi:MAG: enoyl-CoA hydratase/isomerase family protein [Chitinophagales bacterium]|jgi:enoyl-CoA hydratase|nr:enoyl-CoA hydratase/isomerase family protein [Chitinophagales bacterium]